MSKNINQNSNILIIGSNDKFNLEKTYFKTFKHLGYNVDFFNLEKSINHRLIAKVKNYFSNINYIFLRKKTLTFFQNRNKKYHLIFFFKTIFLDTKTIREIRSINGLGFFVNIFPDDPFDIRNSVISNKNFLKSIPEFDLFCIWSKKIIIKLRKNFKTKFLYLPFGYDSLQISKFKFRKKEKRTNEIVFIGTYEKKRYKILNSIKIKKNIFGGNWLRIENNKIKNSHINSHIYGSQIFKMMNKAAISLNILRKQNETSHNMKTFEIPANNGLMLTTRSKEQDFFFKENHASFMYSSKAELNSKIRFILSNQTKAEKVRKNGNSAVKKHSYINRIKFLINEINKINK